MKNLLENQLAILNYQNNFARKIAYKICDKIIDSNLLGIVVSRTAEKELLIYNKCQSGYKNVVIDEEGGVEAWIYKELFYHRVYYICTLEYFEHDWSIRGYDDNCLTRCVPTRDKNKQVYGIRPSYWNPKHKYNVIMPEVAFKS